MSAASFIARIKELHERAKKGTLSPSELAEYKQARVELGRLMLVAQHLSHGGQTLRAALRIAQLLKVELDLGGAAPEKTSTIDVASGGFAALLPSGQPVGRIVGFTIWLPGFSGGTQAVAGKAKVASSRPSGRGAMHRVSFSFDALGDAAREHLEMVLVDSVLSRFNTPL